MNQRTWQLKAASVFLLIQGILMEGLVFLGLGILLIMGVDPSVITARTQVFALPYLAENLYPMMAMSGIFAALRIIGGVALWRGRMWGFALSLVNCLVTLLLMVFLLPAGILDGLLSGPALVLMLRGYFGNRPVLTGHAHVYSPR